MTSGNAATVHPVCGAEGAPRVSVVMSVYNGERYLRQAVESILDQTFTDFEFIIVDDGSSDGTWNILNGYVDPRIRLVRNEENIGLTKSLNKGLALARGQYVARMDADDVSLPERLEKQVSFLDAHAKVGVVGTSYWELTPANERRPMAVPLTDMGIRFYLLFHNAFAHSSVTARKAVLERVGRYDPALPYAQDYDLWTRVAAVSQLANLSHRLLLLRTGTPTSTSVIRLHQQQAVADGICQRAVNGLLDGPTLDLHQVQRLRRFVQLLMAESQPPPDVQAMSDFILVAKRFMRLYAPLEPSREGGLSEVETRLLAWAWSCVHYQGSDAAWQLSRQLLKLLLGHRPRALWKAKGGRLLVAHVLGARATHALLRALKRNSHD